MGGDRTPAAGPARLTERDLAEYDDRLLETRSIAREVGIAADQYDGGLSVAETEALLAALRAAWAENAAIKADADAWTQDRAALWEERDRYRDALEKAANCPEACEVCRAEFRAALAAPGAGEETT